MNLFFRAIPLAFCLISAMALCGPQFKEHEKWWEFKCKEKAFLDQFMSWQGGENAISRILARLHMQQNCYKSVLDVGCGMCVDYQALKKLIPEIDYLGLDVADTFINKVAEQGIPAKAGRVQNIPCHDSAYDVVYARFLLEHLDSYEKAVEEMVRVSAKEVIIVFFIIPDGSPNDKISIININGYPVFHNRYSKNKMENFLKTLEKVKSFSWQEIKAKDECILHIMVA